MKVQTRSQDRKGLVRIERVRWDEMWKVREARKPDLRAWAWNIMKKLWMGYESSQSIPKLANRCFANFDN